MGSRVSGEEAPLQEAGARQSPHQGHRRMPLNKMHPPPLPRKLHPVPHQDTEGGHQKTSTWQPWGLVAPGGEEAGALRERKRKSEKPLQSQSQDARAGRELKGGSRLRATQHIRPALWEWTEHREVHWAPMGPGNGCRCLAHGKDLTCAGSLSSAVSACLGRGGGGGVPDSFLCCTVKAP